MLVPDLGRARESPSLFSLPHEGSGAPRRRMAWISPDRPVFHGRARNAGTLTHMTRASASSRRATRHYRFRVHGQSDRARGLCATGRLPECRPGTWLAFATLAGAASRPTFTTPRDDAPRWTGRL